MKTVKMPVLDRNAKTITATREFLIRAGQFGSTEFNILLDMQKNNPGYTVVEHKIKRNPNKNVHEALNYDEMIDFIKGKLNMKHISWRKTSFFRLFLLGKMMCAVIRVLRPPV